MDRPLLALALSSILLLSPSCTRRSDSPAPEETSSGAGAVSTPRATPLVAVPNKDELARVNGVPLSITGFLALRDLYPGTGDEELLEIALGAMTLQQAAQQQRHTDLSPTAALALVRYARGKTGPAEASSAAQTYFGSTAVPTPAEVRTEIQKQMARVVIKKNLSVLQGLE